MHTDAEVHGPVLSVAISSSVAIPLVNDQQEGCSQRHRLHNVAKSKSPQERIGYGRNSKEFLDRTLHNQRRNR